jgi:hypothetical protein
MGAIPQRHHSTDYFLLNRRGAKPCRDRLPRFNTCPGYPKPRFCAQKPALAEIFQLCILPVCFLIEDVCVHYEMTGESFYDHRDANRNTNQQTDGTGPTTQD